MRVTRCIRFVKRSLATKPFCRSEKSRWQAHHGLPHLDSQLAALYCLLGTICETRRNAYAYKLRGVEVCPIFKSFYPLPFYFRSPSDSAAQIRFASELQYVAQDATLILWKPDRINIHQLRQPTLFFVFLPALSRRNCNGFPNHACSTSLPHEPQGTL
jgi:hypothetical protein